MSDTTMLELAKEVFLANKDKIVAECRRSMEQDLKIKAQSFLLREWFDHLRPLIQQAIDENRSRLEQVVRDFVATRLEASLREELEDRFKWMGKDAIQTALRNVAAQIEQHKYD